MEHLKPFNEAEKRKFRSFQKEKQDAIDKKEEEEKRKKWGSSYNNYGYGYNGGHYEDGYWVSNRPNVPSVPVPSVPSKPKPEESTNTVLILTSAERTTPEAKQRDVYEKALKDLFPAIEVAKLPEACVVKPSSNLYGMQYNKEYDILPANALKTICVINDKGNKVSWTTFWVRRYKKYTFDVFTTPKVKYISMKGCNLSRKPYQIAGETEETYEITDDKGTRKEYPKLWFSLPYKLRDDGGHIISRTEIREEEKNR